MDPLFIAALVAAALLGVALGVFAHKRSAAKRVGDAEDLAKRIVAEARKEAQAQKKEILLQGQDDLFNQKRELENEFKEREREVKARERKLEEMGGRLEEKLEKATTREHELLTSEKDLARKERQLAESEMFLQTRIEEQEQRLSEIAGLTADEAKVRLFSEIEAKTRHESARMIRQIEMEARETADRKAKEILCNVIQRYAGDYVNEQTVTAVTLPSEDMKGRIIGREGRNIRALEMATGVTVIIDDSPGVVVLSSFDPIRREIAKVTLERLVADGRINPALIEEMADKVTAELDDLILKAGEEAVDSLHLARVPLELLKLLGRLKFRTSYSQNVLRHSVEAARLASLMAPEIGLDPDIAKRAALYHDIGKAVDHEVEGRHADIGADLLAKAGESETVVNAVRGHHGEAVVGGAYAALAAAADAITAARPGARSETTDLFMQRMENLEGIAKEEPGVVRSLAMQAGRELRIFVEPTAIDDAAAIQLARRVSKRIEEKLDYPGQIKVTVIRETRCVEYAR